MDQLRDPPVHRRVPGRLDEDHHGLRTPAQGGLLRLPRRARPAPCMRSDRRTFFGGETIRLEAWLCNDLPDRADRATLRYQLELDGKPLQSGSTRAQTPKFAAASLKASRDSKFTGCCPARDRDRTDRTCWTAKARRSRRLAGLRRLSPARGRQAPAASGSSAMPRQGRATGPRPRL